MWNVTYDSSFLSRSFLSTNIFSFGFEIFVFRCDTTGYQLRFMLRATTIWGGRFRPYLLAVRHFGKRRPIRHLRLVYVLLITPSCQDGVQFFALIWPKMNSYRWLNFGHRTGPLAVRLGSFGSSVFWFNGRKELSRALMCKSVSASACVCPLYTKPEARLRLAASAGRHHLKRSG